MPKKKDPLRIPANALERVAKEQFPETVTEQWFHITVTIKRTLRLAEMMEFVNNIVDVCFAENGGFMPEIFDFAVKSGVLTRYANFTLPDDVQKQYQLIYQTDAFEMVSQHINEAQLKELTVAANRKLANLCDSDIQAFRSKMTELIGAINNVQAQTESMFEGMSSEDVMALVNAAKTTGTLSEDKIVDAYIDRLKSVAVTGSPGAAVSDD